MVILEGEGYDTAMRESVGYNGLFTHGPICITDHQHRATQCTGSFGWDAQRIAREKAYGRDLHFQLEGFPTH